MNKLFKNKRGEDMLVDFWAILIFAVIIVLFLIIFSVSSSVHKTQVETKFATKDAEIMLISFINAPAIGEGMTTDKSVGEIIVEDSSINNFDRTEKLFNNFFTESSFNSNIYFEIDGKNSYHMKISNGKSFFERLLIINSPGLLPTITISGSETYDAETYLPGYDGEKIYIRLKKKDT